MGHKSQRPDESAQRRSNHLRSSALLAASRLSSAWRLREGSTLNSGEGFLEDETLVCVSIISVQFGITSPIDRCISWRPLLSAEGLLLRPQQLILTQSMSWRHQNLQALHRMCKIAFTGQALLVIERTLK